MPISPRPPSGGGRPWSSTAIPPAYRRKRIANNERSIPLLTTRGYPLLLGDKMPMRPLSCIPGQHSTPVLAPLRPASSASVPMKATIKENTFKELVEYWEHTTYALFNEVILRNKTATDVDTADAFPKSDVPHEPGNLPLLNKAILRNKTAADVDTADAFPEADVSHKPRNLPLFEEAISCNKTAADANTADFLFDETILRYKTAADVDTADAFPKSDVPHKPGNLPLFEEAISRNKTAADVNTADALFNEVILRNKTAADVDKADAFPKNDVPHEPENLPLLDKAILRNKTAADVDTADAFPEADVPHKPRNPLLFEEAISRNKTATDVNTADALFDETISHNKRTADVNTADALFNEVILRNKTAADVDKADAFPKSDVPHEPENLPLLDKAILRNKTAADVETAEAFPEADVAHNPKNLNDLTTSGIGCTFPENIEIDLRRARTLEQHLVSVKQKVAVAANTTGDEWHRINELQNKMNIIDNILKDIGKKAKFVNEETVNIESESFLIISRMKTPRCMIRKEKEPPGDFQTLVQLPPIPTKAKPTAEIPTKNHLSGKTNKYNASSSQIVKSSSVSRQMNTKPLPAIVPKKGKLNPVVSTARLSTQRRPQTDINNEYKQLERAMERVGRKLGPTPLPDHISYHEPESGRLMRRPRNEQDNVPCRGKSKETKSEIGFKEKPNQRKRNRNRQKKKKIEKAPIKIEDRPPFTADIKPSKYFSNITRLSDVF